MRIIPIIHPNANGSKQNTANGIRKKRVAGYARVSTEFDTQASSFRSQVEYYREYISVHPEWELVDIYTDEGLSGLRTAHREGFNTMIADALSGKIDLIITKSVSRFARNTVDALVTIRELKEHGIEVYFEKENIYTLDSKGELLLTIMASLAQEESRSISENSKWGYRKRFADGKPVIQYSSFFGYRKGKHDKPEIYEPEAKYVRFIYEAFLADCSLAYIAEKLTSDNVRTPRNKSKWSITSVRAILSDVRYKGDFILQKTVMDYMTHKEIPNTGQAPQYYIQDYHEGIISREIWDAAQAELAKRDKLNVATRRERDIVEMHKVRCRQIFGYRYVDRTLVIYEEEAKYVRMIFDLYLSGMTYDAIAATLNEAGVKSCRGGKWGSSSIHTVLANYTYTGNLKCKPAEYADMPHYTFLKQHLPHTILKDTHQAIISLDLFEQTAMMMQHRAFGRFPLSGIIKCGCCGKPYCRITSKGHPYWTCSSKKQKGSPCLSHNLKEEKLNDIIESIADISKITEILFYPDYHLTITTSDGIKHETIYQK